MKLNINDAKIKVCCSGTQPIDLEYCSSVCTMYQELADILNLTFHDEFEPNGLFFILRPSTALVDPLIFLHCKTDCKPFEWVVRPASSLVAHLQSNK